jgi:integrase
MTEEEPRLGIITAVYLQPLRRHWKCSAMQIPRLLDRPAATIPARSNAVEVPIRQLHHVRVGVTMKTLANHRSNVRAALRWFAKEHDVPRHGIRLSADWAAFRAQVDRPLRDQLYSLFRCCSSRGISPGLVDDQVFDDYWRYRAETTALASNNAARRQTVRAWNACIHVIDTWPLQRLTEPPIKGKPSPASDEFAEALRTDIDEHCARLSKPHRGLTGKRLRPCKASTIRTWRAELMAVARMAVRVGVPIDSLNSLAALVHPDVVERVIDAYWQKNGDEPKVFTIGLGWKLLRIAREIGGLDQTAINRLDDVRATLENYRRSGLTSKNLQLVRQVLTEGIWSEVVSLPTVLMQQAHLAKDHAPMKAALTALLAVAVAILTFAPVRLSNLIGIELGKNLIKPGGPDSPYWLVFEHYDVKNRVDLNFKFDQPLTDLIDDYVHEFRPTLLRGSNANWLFPGEGGKPRTVPAFGTQITKRIQKAVGLRITPHQFRHAAAAIYLKHRPGDYETVRRVLGHRNIQMTIAFYCGLQTAQATEQFGNLIRQQIKFDPVT